MGKRGPSRWRWGGQRFLANRIFLERSAPLVWLKSKRFGPESRKGERFALEKGKKAKRFGRESQILALRWD